MKELLTFILDFIKFLINSVEESGKYKVDKYALYKK